jgi:ESF2/ABP1 family protein
MKYLSGFKWEMLGEQVGASSTLPNVVVAEISTLLAYERQAHQSRLRAEIARSKTEQGEYLRNVELARVLDKRKAKKAASNGVGGDAPVGGIGESAEGSRKFVESKKGFRQRQVVDAKAKMEGNGMDSVLGSVFG